MLNEKRKCYFHVSDVWLRVRRKKNIVFIYNTQVQLLLVWNAINYKFRLTLFPVVLTLDRVMYAQTIFDPFPLPYQQL